MEWNYGCVIEILQSKVLRSIANVPWYVKNKTIHYDLQVAIVRKVIQCASTKYIARLKVHQNLLFMNLLYNSAQMYRLK